ncbi:MAG: hypothetical protein Ct9H300mP1_23830 [Planctomycetaceae bacterium]|nr:MAG: hypothetical protein Ct9H300mP1_23830 [Planctomycetaceae bacterium]
MDSTETGRWLTDGLRLKVGVIRSLSTARFCRILGTLLHNGVPILNSLRIAKDASGNQVLAQAINTAADAVPGRQVAGRTAGNQPGNSPTKSSR